jgi:hypothetical protein
MFLIAPKEIFTTRDLLVNKIKIFRAIGLATPCEHTAQQKYFRTFSLHVKK